MPTVSYRKYAGKKQANVKPMIVLMFVVGLILVISVIVVIIMKMTGGSGTIDEDGSTIGELPGMIDDGESKNEEDASMISKIVIKIGEREFTATLEKTEAAQAFAK